ncbi:4332_t:CDS:1 [Funneliformis mosseae]|uniref:4332_t:CDS:1 n=1 Tax=Funneliformis mosseae TaxID=27381 RepID=A0A9N9FL84_FUNMO|nr:4332_t:CDS:1 [Funneliformis mosseae]
MPEKFVVQLPADCLRVIFENLSGDIRTLRNLLLVNRLWCETVVPILWRNPFKRKRLYNFDQGFWTTITRTLLSCLPEESIILFRHNGINPPNLLLDEKSGDRKLALFDYFGFCQNISCQDIYEIIPEILGPEHPTDITWFYNGNLVENELWKLFMSRCSTIKYLEIPNISIDYYTNINKNSTSLSYLVELECSTYKSSQLFLDLAQICKDIKKITVNLCDNDNEGLVSLISMQKGLEEIILISSIEGSQCTLIGEAIGTQYPSLTSISLEEHIRIPSTTFSKLINLKHIRIDLEENVNSKMELLDNCSFPFLESLEIRNVHEKYLDLYTKLINNTNGSLKHLEIDTVPHPYLYHIRPYWQALIKHCTQLEFVTLWFKDDSLNDLKDLLKTCGSKMKGIIFEAVLGQFSWRPLDLNPLFEVLVELVGGNGTIEELHFSGTWTFSPKDLRKFLSLWGKKNLIKESGYKDHRKIRKPLYLSTKVDFQISKEIIDIFEEFVENGVLKGWSR